MGQRHKLCGTTLFNWQCLLKLHASPAHTQVSTCSSMLEIITIMLFIETPLLCPLELSTCNVIILKMNNTKLLIAASSHQHTHKHSLVADVPCAKQWKECGCLSVDWWLATPSCWKYVDLNILHTCSRAQIARLACNLWVHLHKHKSRCLVSGH